MVLTKCGRFDSICEHNAFQTVQTKVGLLVVRIFACHVDNGAPLSLAQVGENCVSHSDAGCGLQSCQCEDQMVARQAQYLVLTAGSAVRFDADTLGGAHNVWHVAFLTVVALCEIAQRSNRTSIRDQCRFMKANRPASTASTITRGASETR